MKKSVTSHLRSISSYAAVGALGLTVMTTLTGCEQQQQSSGVQNVQSEGYFIVIQEVAPQQYKIAEQYPTPGTTRAILKKLDGTEQLLSQEELRQLSAAEAQKVEAGTSNLLQPQDQMTNNGGGMGIGEAILASAAGAIIGSWLGNKLFNNPNYQQRSKSQPGAISRSYKNAGKSSATSKPQKSSGYMNNTPKKSGYMSRSSSSRSFGG